MEGGSREKVCPFIRSFIFHNLMQANGDLRYYENTQRKGEMKCCEGGSLVIVPSGMKAFCVPKEQTN